jgi:hypothetical protein
MCILECLVGYKVVVIVSIAEDELMCHYNSQEC